MISFLSKSFSLSAQGLAKSLLEFLGFYLYFQEPDSFLIFSENLTERELSGIILLLTNVRLFLDTQPVQRILLIAKEELMLNKKYGIDMKPLGSFLSIHY